MKALFYAGERSFRLGEAVASPLQKNEVRLRVAYCGICGTDVHIYHGSMDGRVKIPQVIGHEVSGVIDELGPEVSGWQVGDRVTVRPLQPGEPHPSDGAWNHIGRNMKFIGIDTEGGMQALWTVPAYTLHRLPDSLGLQTGALIEPLAVACHDIRLGGVKAGEYVVVVGGGPIGLLIALVAKEKGAKVLISEVSEARLALASELGLEAVNPLKEDLPARVEKFTEGQMADVVFEVSGVQAGVSVMTQLPKARGRVVMVAIHPTPKQVDLFRFFWREIQLIGARVYESADFEEAIRLAESGKLPLERLITRVAPLEEANELFQSIENNPAGMKYLLQVE